VKTPVLRTIARAGVALALVGLLAVGALHSNAGRALLGASGCPFDPAAKPASPETIEDFRKKSLASMRVGGKATARPALGLTLGASTRTEASSWASGLGLACEGELGGAALRCEGRAPRDADVTAKPRAMIRDAYFRFAPDGTLVALDILHEGTTAARALASAQGIVAALEAKLGAAARVVGDPTAQALEAGRSSRAGFELHFDDYAADVSATNLASDDVARGREIVVREQYRLLSELPVR
jgi:hypothetical protein